MGGAIVLGLLVVYVLSNPSRDNIYNHFVWQAKAWLEGTAAISFPVPENAYFNDVMPVLTPAGASTGRGLLPFPPLPALVLLPFVAVFGLATNAQLIAAVLAALVVGAAFVALGRLDIGASTRLATTLFFGLGTVLWYSAAVGSTWYQAHVVALVLAFGAVAIGLDRERADRSGPSAGTAGLLDARLIVAGLLLGLAATARLPVALGGAFFLFVGGGSLRRRAASIAVGVAVPLLGLVAYNVVSTGSVFSPAYDYLYRYELFAYPELGYHSGWSVEDPRYIPQNLVVMLLQPPDILPACVDGAMVRGFFDKGCPWLVPDPVGMSLLLTSPAYLLVLPALRRLREEPIIAGGLAASVLIATLDLMHFSQGWVQFGYRFSLDFVPFLLPAVAFGLDGLRGRRRAVGYALIGVSVAVSLWGVIWRAILGW